MRDWIEHEIIDTNQISKKNNYYNIVKWHAGILSKYILYLASLSKQSLYRTYTIPLWEMISISLINYI